MRHTVGVWVWAWCVCVVAAGELRRDEAGVLRSILFGVESPVLYSTSSSSTSSGRHSSSHPWGSRSYHRIYRDSNIQGGGMVQDSSPGTTYYTSSNQGTIPHGTHQRRISHDSLSPQRTHYSNSRDNTAHRTHQHMISQDSSDPQRTSRYPNSRVNTTHRNHQHRISHDSSDPQRTPHYSDSRDNTGGHGTQPQHRTYHQNQSVQGTNRDYTTQRGTSVDSTGHHNKGTSSSSSSDGDIQHYHHHQTPPHIRTSQDSSVSHGVSESHNPHHRTSEDPYSHRTQYRTPHQGYGTHHGASADSDSGRTQHRTFHYSQPRLTHHNTSTHGTEDAQSRDEEVWGHTPSIPQPHPNPALNQPSGALPHRDVSRDQGNSFRAVGGRGDGGDSRDSSMRTYGIPGHTSRHSDDTRYSEDPPRSSFEASYNPGDTRDGGDTHGGSWGTRVSDGDAHTHSGDTLGESGEPRRPDPHFPASIPDPHHSDPVQHPNPHDEDSSHSQYSPGYSTVAGHTHTSQDTRAEGHNQASQDTRGEGYTGASQDTRGEGHTRASQYTRDEGHIRASQDTRGEEHDTPEEHTDPRPNLCCGSVVPLDSQNILSTGEFSRVAPIGSIKVVAVPAPDTDLYPPGKVKDLKVSLRGPNAMALTWTTPGDDFDSGAVSRYTLRLSPTVSDLQESQFNQAPETTLVELPEEALRSGRVYQEAGTRVGMRLPLPTWLMQGRVYYLALRAYDDQDNQSPVSNLARLFLPRTSVGHVVVRTPYEHTPARHPTTTAEGGEGHESGDTVSVNVESASNTDGGGAVRYTEHPVTPSVDDDEHLHRLSPAPEPTETSVSGTVKEVSGGQDSSTSGTGRETEEVEEEGRGGEGERTRNNRRNKKRKNKKRKNKRKGGRKGRRGGGGGRRRQEESSSDSDPSACGLGVQERQHEEETEEEEEEVSLCQARASLSLVITYFEQQREVAHLDYLWAAMNTLDQKMPPPWQNNPSSGTTNTNPSRRSEASEGGSIGVGGGGGGGSSSSSNGGGGDGGSGSSSNGGGGGGGEFTGTALVV
ncbi:hypothetical protein Pcinc_033001 [Petrolisthes cinctipes]|uniref:Fibronectin type-III domain-containing protein n=1 Tax=Petrolisthes cinctipes TaxID=88211 RepID=A0AAE1ET63_PETCI|nr:hypothetical protein Pcinc_033001 [Petrolisthes cinctipes]